MTETVALDVQQAISLAADVLARANVPRDIAEEVAAHLIDADCVGHGSHGISRLASYLDYIDNGLAVPEARPEVIDAGSTPLVSAHWGFSHVAARMTLELACERAQQNRIGIAGLVRSTHLGRLGAYMERACQLNCVALAFVGGMGGRRLVAPFGGREGLLGTNPIAAGFPTSSGSPFIIDFSTASTPIGKVMVAAMAGERLPTQSLVDREGRPTDDPHALENGGAMRTFGEHKGFGLAVLIELLGRVLLGAADHSKGQGGELFGGQGLVVVAVAADAFRDLSDVLEDAEILRELIHGVPAAAGFAEVLAPGDPERLRRERHVDTFAITAGAWDSVRAAVLRVGLTDERLASALA